MKGFCNYLNRANFAAGGFQLAHLYFHFQEARLRIGIYPGSFDPVTLGHWDLIQRASKLVDQLIVGVLQNPSKNPTFSLVERMGFLEELSRGQGGIEVATFNGLLVEYARQRSAKFIIRGVRAFSDFEYEFQMALTNRKLAPELETVFLMPKEENSVISSRIVREVGMMGGDISDLVPTCLKDAIASKLAQASVGNGGQ
jgi:pantetheine-phosphate adenylyltransferase